MVLDNKKITFNQEEKVAMFDEIASLFYNKNFGQASKAEIELLMFNFYIEKLMDTAKNDNDAIDYNKCSDFVISKELGITQQRVRNLKVKKQLVYPRPFIWQEELGRLMKNARFDPDTRLISIGIPDPNLYYEIQNAIEEIGGHIEIQLNSKLLRMRAEYFIELAVSLEEEKTKQKIIKEINRNLKESNKENKKLDSSDVNIGKNIIVGVLNGVVSLPDLVKTIESQFVMGKIIIHMLSNVIKS